MKNRENVADITISSGNVFADLNLDEAEKLKVKSGLVIEISNAIQRLGLTKAAAARRMGLPQPKCTNLLNGHISGFSERKLMDCLVALGYEIEIRVTPPKRSKREGALTLSVA